MARTIGPAKKICQKKAMGKFMAVVYSHTAITSFPADLNSKVAIRLMVGHISHTVTEEIAMITRKGVSFPGVTMRKAIFLERLP